MNRDFEVLVETSGNRDPVLAIAASHCGGDEWPSVASLFVLSIPGLQSNFCTGYRLAVVNDCSKDRFRLRLSGWLIARVADWLEFYQQR